MRNDNEQQLRNMERFEELKKIILERAREAQACRKQYGRAYMAEDLQQLMEVVRDNFHWAVNNSVIDGDLIDTYRDEFNAGRIWHNEDVTEGFLLANDNATVRAYDNATVIANDNATVIASGNATVRAYGNATVIAYDNATVRAYDNATVEANGNATVRAYGNATVRAYDNATVIANGNATVRAYDNATVEACGRAYVTSCDMIECKISDSAIWRIQETNTIRYSDPEMKFERVD